MLDDPITALLVDSQGDLWASHHQGLLHYDGETWESVEIRTPFAGITALAEDRRGRIWAGGQDGLSVYDP
jgi:ligand-binding sensor domain-containing protein